MTPLIGEVEAHDRNIGSIAEPINGRCHMGVVSKPKGSLPKPRRQGILNDEHLS